MCLHMIGDLVLGREKSRFILIHDSVEANGRAILLSYLVSLSTRLDEIHLFTFDVKATETTEAVESLGLTNVKIHKGSKDILGWENSAGITLDTDLSEYLTSQTNLKDDQKIAIVIDSLSPLLLHRPVPYTCKTISTLSNGRKLECEVEQTICLLHSDLHDDGGLALLNHTATTVHHVLPLETSGHMFCCNTLHKKPSGKIIRITENFNMTEQYMLRDIAEVKGQRTDLRNDKDDTQVDPAANLTFNLSLSEKEKEARSNVKLPYRIDQEKQEATLNKSVGEGKIFYQPDEADDFDEDDPDDDLDI